MFNAPFRFGEKSRHLYTSPLAGSFGGTRFPQPPPLREGLAGGAFFCETHPVGPNRITVQSR